jgi:hypothetical protein
MTPSPAPPDSRGASPYVDLVDRLIAAAAEDARVRALWIEGDSMPALRRPFGRVAVHAMADEPEFPALVAAWPGILERSGADLSKARWSDAPRNARQLDAEFRLRGLSGAAVPLTCVIECSAFLAKRPRKAVLPLVDKTCHLTHMMTFVRG